MIDALAAIGRRAGRVTTGLLALVLLAYGALIGVPTLLGYQTYAITTGSMAGTADPGSLVISDQVPVADLVVGDVITYLPPAESGIEHHVTHRLVEVDVAEDGTRVMRTQGDAIDTADPWTFVLDDEVQSRMRTAIPFAGRPVLAMGDRQVRMLVIGLPAGVIALLAVAEIVQVLRDPEDEDGAVLAEAEIGVGGEGEGPDAMLLEVEDDATSPTRA